MPYALRYARAAKLCNPLVGVLLLGLTLQAHAQTQPPALPDSKAQTDTQAQTDTRGQADAPAESDAQGIHKPRFDYPTTARADYVIGCLAANGFQHRLLDQCSCSIDTIANLMSYADYERAETILSMQQASVGPRGGLFRDTPVARESLQQMQRAQGEANLRCGG